jgi:hypothetical protein
MTDTPEDDKLQRKIKKRDMLNREIREARRNKKKRSMENHRKILAGDEWIFERSGGVVIACHTSGFTVSLPTYLGLKAKVLADAGYKSQRDRKRLIMFARRALRKLHGGRETWETTA